VVSGVFIPEEDDEVRDRRSRGTTMVDIQTLLEAFLNMLPVSVMKLLFLIKSKTSGLRTTLLKCWIIRISGLSDNRLK
jgi:hypothetical protein